MSLELTATLYIFLLGGLLAGSLAAVQARRASSASLRQPLGLLAVVGCAIALFASSLLFPHPTFYALLYAAPVAGIVLIVLLALDGEGRRTGGYLGGLAISALLFTWAVSSLFAFGERHQAVFSFLLLAGLAVGLSATVMLSLARFFALRRRLGGVAFLGFAVFLWALMILTPPPLRTSTFYYWLFSAAIIGGGIGCVTMRNVFHAALMLILCLFGVGGYFILTNAEFLAMVQVIIYIGGIMVLFLFGIMVSQNIIGQEQQQLSPQAPWAAAAAFVLFLFMSFIGLTITFPPSPNQGGVVLESNTQAVGWSLMATFSLPFEVASILLLMAMLGAIVLVRKD